MSRPTLTWAFLARAGSERDLVEELGEDHLPEALAEGVVVAAARPNNADHTPRDPAFARQAMRLDGPPAPLDAEVLADRLTSAMHARLPRSGSPWSWALQIVAPDSRDPKDRRRAIALELGPVLKDALLARLPEDVRAAEVPEAAHPNRLVQAWIVDEERALVGVTPTSEVITLVAAGRVRMRRPDDAPSRAGLKLEEAIAWAGLGPEKGDICVDLGAAPGGWSQVAVERGAIVIAIDPANIKIELPSNRFTHVKESAFEYAPSETLDWLLCDMAWRPLEVAKLVAKWGRRVWARQLIANFKLPMRKKAEILAQIRAIIEEAGWRGVRTRQLYFDRDEVTIFAWLDPNVAKRGLQAPFRLRSKKNHGELEERPRSKGPRRSAEGRKAEPRSRDGAPRGRGPRSQARSSSRSEARGSSRSEARGSSRKPARGVKTGPRGRPASPRGRSTPRSRGPRR